MAVTLQLCGNILNSRSPSDGLKKTRVNEKEKMLVEEISVCSLGDTAWAICNAKI